MLHDFGMSFTVPLPGEVAIARKGVSTSDGIARISTKYLLVGEESSLDQTILRFEVDAASCLHC